MGASTGPMLAVGAVTLFNDVIIHGRPVQQEIKVIVGTGVAAAGLALLERIAPAVAAGLAWTALVAVLFTRINPAVPSPIEAFNTWYNGDLIKKGMRGTRT